MRNAHFSRSHVVFLKLLLVSIFISVQIYECKAACSLLNPNPKEKKLLKQLQPLNGHTFETNDLIDPANYSYKISICDKIKGEDDGVGVVQISKNGNHSLGRYDKVEVMGGNNWMILKYYGGDKYKSLCNYSERVTQIMIICDPDVLFGDLEILEERNSSLQECFYLFELGSNVSCSSKPPVIDHKRYSSGSVFCILFFTLGLTYLIVGFLYQRFVIGAKGLEQIPNYTFWKDFGNLQADGCDYICRCGPRQESQAYRGIDDHLKMEDERDDQLLNM